MSIKSWLLDRRTMRSIIDIKEVQIRVLEERIEHAHQQLAAAHPRIINGVVSGRIYIPGAKCGTCGADVGVMPGLVK